MSINLRVPDRTLDIPGLVFRPFRGEVDYPIMVDIMNQCNLHDDLDLIDTVEDIAVRFAHPVNYDPYQDVVFAEVNGKAVGYSHVWWGDEAGGERIYYLYWYLLPGWREHGIGEAMQVRCEQRIQQIASQHPNDMPRRMQTWAFDSEPYLSKVVEAAGFKQVRYFYRMVRPIRLPLPEAPLPSGLEVRPVLPEHLRLIWNAKDEAFRDHWGYAQRGEEDYQRWLEIPYYDRSLWKVAWDGDQIAGMVLNYVMAEENQRLNRRRGYTETIAVRRPWRRKGLAKALLVQSIEMFRHMGMEETALGVDIENPNGALKLYEGVGYEVKKIIYTYRKELD